jgi:hypothetical protein
MKKISKPYRGSRVTSYLCCKLARELAGAKAIGELSEWELTRGFVLCKVAAFLGLFLHNLKESNTKWTGRFGRHARDALHHDALVELYRNARPHNVCTSSTESR